MPSARPRQQSPVNVNERVNDFSYRLAAGSNWHLCPGLPCGLRLCGHGALQLHRQPHVLDLHTLHLDTPGVGGVVKGRLHHVADRLPFGQNLREVLGAEHVAQGGRGQKSGGVASG